MTVLRVACGARRDYAPHAAAMLHSVVLATPEARVEAHMLHGPDLPRRARERLRRTVAEAGGELTLHLIAPERIAGLPGARGIAPTAWYRLLLPELVDAEAVLYLDCDLIAVRSLAPLLEMDLEGVSVAAVENVWEPWHADWPGRLGIPPAQGYFNSGVVLMHLSRLRETGRDAALLAYVRDHLDRTRWLDQDVLNAVLGDERIALHPRFNAMNSVMTFDAEATAVFGGAAVAEARAEPVIRHWEGPGVNKPWHLLCPYPDRGLYLAHRRATAFGRGVPTGLTPANLVRRALRT